MVHGDDKYRENTKVTGYTSTTKKFDSSQSCDVYIHRVHIIIWTEREIKINSTFTMTMHNYMIIL